MKKIAILSSLIFLFSINISKAQYFIGGNIGFSSNGGSQETNGISVDKTTNTSFSFSPMGGYFLSEKIAAGLGINYSSLRTTTPGSPETIDISRTFGFTPFIRYYAIRINKFSAFEQGYFNLSFGSNKTEVGSVTTTGPKTTSFSFGFTPGISYDITDKISLEANINLLNLNYKVSKVTSTSNSGNETKNVTSNFTFGAGLTNIATTGSISIGAIFRL